MDFSETEAVIGPTTFSFTKLGAMEGWNVLERIREEVGKTADLEKLEFGEDMKAMAVSLLKAVLALPSPVVEEIRRRLFASVQFKSASTTWQALAGAEDSAFNGLESSAIYEVMGRSLSVNFFGSFAGIAATISKTRLRPTLTPS